MKPSETARYRQGAPNSSIGPAAIYGPRVGHACLRQNDASETVCKILLRNAGPL